MGDISEYRGLITVVTFLGVFALLLALPAEMFIASSQNQQVSVPSSLFQVEDIYVYAETVTLNLNDSAPTHPILTYMSIWNFELGGHQLSFNYVTPNASGVNYGFYLFHVYYEWWIFPSDHKMTFYQTDGQSLGTDVLLSELSESNQDMLRVKCQHLTVDVGFAYNETLYTNYEDAYDHNGMYALFGIQFDQVNTSYNAMGLIASLLFFSLPGETPSILGAIISIPLWACISYLVFIFVLRTIGAIFGGGA